MKRSAFWIGSDLLFSPPRHLNRNDSVGKMPIRNDGIQRLVPLAVPDMSLLDRNLSMKLINAQIRNFRCIVDSGPVEIGLTTCLVGKNEAGKTAFLKALEGVRSAVEECPQYNEDDYPRRYAPGYSRQNGEGNAIVAETVWELNEEEKGILGEEFGDDVVTGKEVIIRKSYGDDPEKWEIPIDEVKLAAKICAKYDLSQEEMDILSDCQDTPSIFEKLESIESRSQPQQDLLDEISKYDDNDVWMKAKEIVEGFTPKFLYFSNYDRMSGEISINKLDSDVQQEAVKSGDQLFLDFLEYAGTSLEELRDATKFERLQAMCERAANSITDQIFEYWTQNEHLQIGVLLSEAKPEDLPPFNTGLVARARVENTLHRASVPFSERSTGFVWFFSFLVKFAQITKNGGNVIILLDEPGLTLHGTAQQDLLRYFKEKLEPKHQLIYSTHSLFMVPADNLASVRTVEDIVKKDERGRSYSEGTKISDDVLTTDPQTNFPLLGAMGFAVTQSLVVAPDTLLVEGPADILYLRIVSQKLRSLRRMHLHSKWAICPAGGIDKIMPFVSLFHGNKLNMVVLTDFDRNHEKKLERIYTKKLLERERIVLATDIAEQEEADIEDFFAPEFFLELVNATYNLKGRNEITMDSLKKTGEKSERLVKKVEACFRLLPENIPNFSHYEPADHLLRHPELLDGDSDGVKMTLDRFEMAFTKIAKYA